MKQIPSKAWLNYVARLARLNEKAGQLMQAYTEVHETADAAELISYAYGLVTKYGEGSAALACEMYDALAELQGAHVPAAEPAETAEYSVVARMVNATRNSTPQLKSGVNRLVKRAGADTTLKNALRDGTEFAWVPSGDTCAFCLTLASRGWQKASKKAIKGGHAEHIHANCDCTYAIRFNSEVSVEGYDPDAYLKAYRDAGSDVNELRRIHYAENRERINAQKRAAYAARNEKKPSTTEGKSDKIKETDGGGIFDILPLNPVTKERYQPHLLKMTDTQFGKKVGKHASDFGMDPSSAEAREQMKQIIYTIVNDADERFYGEWRGQEYPVLFHVKGNDVVIENSSGEFVTILKGGTTNARVENARKSQI